jgi:hypothetical protein
MINSRIITINSSNRDTGTNSNFTYSYPLLTEEYDHCVLLSATIPISFYLIQDGQNYFTLKEGSQEVLITVPAGNYNINSFKIVLSNLLTNNSPNSIVYNMLINNAFTQVDDGKFTYTISNNGFIQPEFIFTKYLTEQTGFNRNTTYQFNNTLKSVNVINFVPEQSIFIKSNLVETSNNSKPTLQTIYSSNEKPYSIIKYECQDYLANSKKLSNIGRNYFNITLEDENGNELFLNGRNWLASILFFKKDLLHREYYKYKILNEK